MLVESLNDELFTPLHYSDNIRCCKGKGVFYLMFEVTVSMLPLYTKPLRAYIVELLNMLMLFAIWWISPSTNTMGPP